MKRQTKFIVYILILCLFVSNTFFGYTLADGESNQEKNKCIACNSTPTSMQLFINFEVELLGILQGASGQSRSSGTNKKSGLFAGGLLSLPKAVLQSTVKKVKNDFDSEMKAARAARITAILLTIMSISGVEDSLYSVQILFKDDAFVRDYKILQELDMAINDIIWDMGVSGIWDNRVSSSVKSEIIGLQNKYSQEGGSNSAIFERISIASDIKYKELLLFVLQLNSTVKSMLMALGDNTPLLDSKLYDFEELYSKGSIEININEDYIDSIKMDYSCVSSATCNKNVKEALKGLLNIKKFQDSFKRTKDTINDANKNLKEAFGSRSNYDGFGGWLKKEQKSGGTGGLTDRQVELLYTVYGIDAHNLTTSQLDTLKQNFAQMTSESQSLLDAVKDGLTTAKAVGDTVAKTSKGVFDLGKNRFNKISSKGTEQEKNYTNKLTQEEKDELLSKIKWQTNIPISNEGKNLIDYMQNTVDEILVEKGKDKEILLVSVNHDTHYFVEIGEYIHSIVKGEIGDKNTDGLVKLLGETCTYQCNNHGGECYSK